MSRGRQWVGSITGERRNEWTVTPHSLYVHEAYRQVQTETAGPEETVVLLFEGMLRFLYQARQAMEVAQYERQSNLIGRVLRILTELIAALDDTQDEALVVSLRCSYTGMYNRLVEANIRDDLELLDEVTELMEKFAQAWRTALQNLQNVTASSPVAVNAA